MSRLWSLLRRYRAGEVLARSMCWLFMLALVVACTSNISTEVDDLTTQELDIIVPPSTDGSFPPELWISCGQAARFQVSDLEQITPVEPDSDLAKAMEPFLLGEEGQFWPQDDWLVLRNAPEQAVIVNHQDDMTYAFMELSQVDGTWTWSGATSGSCSLQYAVPDGLGRVNWRLDPTEQPNPESTQLRMLLSEEACASGQEIGDRLRGPQVEVTENSVWIAFAAVSLSGAQTCPSNPEISVIVELPEALGTREIIGGYDIGIALADYLP